MTDLAARLAEALDLAEQAARAAMHLGDGRWRVDHGSGLPCPAACSCCRVEGAEITIYDEGGHDEHQAAHIAAWDPATVLRLIARDRALLAAHRRYLCDEFGYHMCATDGQVWPCDDVERAAAFWLPPEATDA